MKTFLKYQYSQIKHSPSIIFIKLLKFFLYIPALFLFLLVIILRPLILIRIGAIVSSRLGHFAGNTELYLCEKFSGINKVNRVTFDLFYYEGSICNKQLSNMWSRCIFILPKYCTFIFLNLTNIISYSLNFSPILNTHIIKSSKSDRDVHDLLNKSPINLKFTRDELIKGSIELKKIGIPENAKIVLLNVRDSEYLDNFNNTIESTHSYRNCNIDNFVLVSEELASRGYFVIRLGVLVKNPLKTNNPMIIDYAFKGIRTDFMDVYLASICDFILTTGSGGDALAVNCFRKPVVYVNLCPILDFPTFLSNAIAITKHHIDIENSKELTFKEIISKGVGFSLASENYINNGVILEENTPEEIRDIALEMLSKISDTWIPLKIDSILQSKFWEIFPQNKLLHGQEMRHGRIRMNYGANFLRNYRWWLD